MDRGLDRGRAVIGRACLALVAIAVGSGCGGGSPLLHPARTLPKGEVRAAGGVSANVIVGELASQLRSAREIAARDPSGASSTSAEYARGAVALASAAPGLAPLVGARVGIGSAFEGGLAYTGRSTRVDVRRSFDDGHVSLSIGVGGTALIYGREQGTPLPNVALGALHGYGADLPVLVGYESDGGLYRLWAGVRGGFEHAVLSQLTSERTTPRGPSTFRLDATRFYGGALAGFAVGFNHVHVALELSAAYQSIDGSFGGNDVVVRGISLAPATALWWSF